MPLIAQTEAAECGLACLAMIAAVHGYEVPLSALRRRFSMSIRGTSLRRIIEIAHNLKLESRPLKVEIGALRHLQMPCILHWDLSHFVVLKSVRDGVVEIHDPASGHRTMLLSEASSHFTGVALELKPALDFRPAIQREPLPVAQLLGAARSFVVPALKILAIAVGLEACTLLLPFQMQWVIDQVLVTSDVGLLSVIGVAFALLIVFQTALSLSRGWLVAWVGSSLSAEWVIGLFGHLLRLPQDYFEKRQTGDVISRIGSVQSIQQTLTGNFVDTVLNGITAFLILLLLLFYSPALTALVIVAFVVYASTRRLLYKRVYRVTEAQITMSARRQTFMMEAIRGVQTIKLGSKQAEWRGRFANISVDIAAADYAIQRAALTFTSTSQFVFGLLRVLTIWLAARMVVGGSFTAGMLVAFATYADQFSLRAAALIDKLVELRMLKLHLHRIADIALTPAEENVDGTYGGVLPDHSLTIDNVSFRYAEDEPWVLRHCSVRINANESTAITGPSGCGKSTLAKIMMGLLEPTEGRVLLGGVDIRKYGLDRYRAIVAAVMQDDDLFEGTVADNISFFDSDASLDRIVEAARLASIHSEIETMPMGYETHLGDMGSSLSGGQRQRVLFARALYRKPRILLLDEATSHLDVLTERAVNRAVGALETTRIIIAHRAETLASARHVIHLQHANRREMSDERDCGAIDRHSAGGPMRDSYVAIAE